MTDTATKQRDAPPERLDGRITVNDTELATVVSLLQQLVTEEWVADALQSSYGLDKNRLGHAAAKHLVVALIQRLNLARLGHAEGTVATHTDGRLARRYYSAAEKRLTWLIVHPPSDEGLVVDSGPELPGFGWRVRDDVPWQVAR